MLLAALVLSKDIYGLLTIDDVIKEKCKRLSTESTMSHVYTITEAFCQMISSGILLLISVTMNQLKNRLVHIRSRMSAKTEGKSARVIDYLAYVTLFIVLVISVAELIALFMNIQIDSAFAHICRGLRVV